MKKTYFLTLISLFSFSLFACGGDSNLTYDERFFLVGYGSYVNGLNFEIDSGIELNKLDDREDGAIASYRLVDASFNIGDTFIVTNLDKNIILDSSFIDTSSGSFSTNNAAIYEGENTQVDILKTGKYDIYLNVFKDDVFELRIENGEGTTSNLDVTKPSGDVVINIYANGDQHGVVEETLLDGKLLPSMPTYVSYLKEQMNSSVGEDIIISNGDLWQGTYASNFNYGAMLNEIIEEVGYSSFTLGNHEFDWGEEVLKENKINSAVPYLGANVVVRGSETLQNYVQPFTIVEKSGLKIGIIGTIGRTQLTSITSSQVENVDFLNDGEAVEENADRLRKEFGCDIVIACFHNDTSNLRSVIRNLGNISEVSGKRYVDAVFTAHDHIAARGLNNGIPYLNSGNNNKNLSHIALNYNDGVVATLSYENLITTDLENVKEDEKTREIIDRYCTEEIKEKANTVVATLDETFPDNDEAPKMMAKAVYDYVVSSGEDDIVLSIVNQARADLVKGDITYGQLLDSFPFFNKTLVFNASGMDLISIVSSNYYYSPSTDWEIDGNKTYKIAVCDYLALHQNTQHKYDYFQFSHPINILNTFDKYPCDILNDYLLSFDDVISISDYQTQNYSFLD